MSEYIISEYHAELCDAIGYTLEPIVRCRDCKYCAEETRHGLLFNEPYTVTVCDCEQWSTSSLKPPHTVNPDGFCAWGERKEA